MASYADCDVIILYVLCKFCVLCFLVLLFLFLIAFELVIMCFVMIEKSFVFRKLWTNFEDWEGHFAVTL